VGTDADLSVIDELWVALATEGSLVLNELVRLQRKQFSSSPEAAGLGVPSIGMVAFLLAAGHEGLTVAGMSDVVGSDRKRRSKIDSLERMLLDKVDGVRRLQTEDVQAIGHAAALSDDTVERLTRQVVDDVPKGKPYCKAVLSTDHVVRALHQDAIDRAGTGAPVVLAGVAAVLRFADEHPDIDPGVVHAEVYGVITDRSKHASGLVLVLTDGLLSLNLVANRYGDSFEVAKGCAIEDRIRVTGVLGRTRRGDLTVYIEACEKLVDGDLIPDKRQLLNNLQRRGLPPRVLLGTVVQEIGSALWELNFIRYEPTIVSSALTDGDTVEALDLYFPGLGARTSLVPSPAPQLIRAGIGLGIPRLFATSRIITRAIRDGFTSADSPATFAFLLNANLDQTISVVEAVLGEVLARIVSSVSRSAVASDPPWPRLTESEQPSTPSFHLLSSRQMSPRGFEVTPFAVRIGTDYDVVEGHVAHISSHFDYAIFNIQPERLLQVFRTVDANRLVRFQGPESLLTPGVSL
jgi:hypothetical protein